MAITAANVKTNINNLMTKAQDQHTSETDKKANIAEALAYFLELERNAGNELINIDNERLNRDFNRIYNSDALSAVQRQGKLNEFSALSPKELNDKLNSLDKEISQYAGPGEENPKRASKLYDQMNSTWRVASDSKEFGAAKKAMRRRYLAKFLRVCVRSSLQSMKRSRTLSPLRCRRSKQDSLLRNRTSVMWTNTFLA